MPSWNVLMRKSFPFHFCRLGSFPSDEDSNTISSVSNKYCRKCNIFKKVRISDYKSKIFKLSTKKKYKFCEDIRKTELKEDFRENKTEVSSLLIRLRGRKLIFFSIAELLLIYESFPVGAQYIYNEKSRDIMDLCFRG